MSSQPHENSKQRAQRMTTVMSTTFSSIQNLIKNASNDY